MPAGDKKRVNCRTLSLRPFHVRQLNAIRFRGLARDVGELVEINAVRPSNGQVPFVAMVSTIPVGQVHFAGAAQLPEHANVAGEQGRHQDGANYDGHD